MMAQNPESWMLGAAIRAHCDEGKDFDSDWWRWEQRPGRITDISTSQEGAGHLDHWRDDLELARKLGLRTLLISLSWARIQPTRDGFSQPALDHYRAVFAHAHAAGIQLVCVPWDTALPLWFVEAGGWRQQGAPGQFAHYVRTAAEVLGPYCRHWVPAYEAAWWLDRSSTTQAWPSGVKGWWPARPLARHMAQGLLMAAEVLRSTVENVQIGHSVRWRFAHPRDPHSPWDYRASQWAHNRWNHLYLSYLCNRNHAPDFVLPSFGGDWCTGFQPIGFRGGFVQASPLPAPPHSQDPILRVCQALKESGVNLPVLWLEHGVSGDDPARCARLHTGLHQLQACTSPVMGYIYGRFLDGFEWQAGYTQRQGIVHVDHEDFARTPNSSAFLLQEFAQHNHFLPGTDARFTS